MSRDRFDVLERYVPLFEMPEPSYERFLRRRDRKRRNQRIAAGVVGMALFVTAVLVVAAAGLPDRSQTPASTGPTFIEPTTGPTVLPGVPVGSVGLPPEGATPSTPERGSLVLSSHFTHTPGDPGRVELYLYEDGRLITRQLAGGGIERTTGFLERRLTPEGVELLRSEALSTGLFDRNLGLAAPALHSGEVQVLDGDRLVRVAWGDLIPVEDPVTSATPEQRSALERLDTRLQDPASWLPATAWEDPETRPYVPSGYSVCYEADPSIGLTELLALLPPSAEDLLRNNERTRGEYEYGPFPPRLHPTRVTYWCSDMTTDETRALAEVLERLWGWRSAYGLPGAPSYFFEPPDGPSITIGIEPLLPHD